jgi:hypothetical protein
LASCQRGLFRRKIEQGCPEFYQEKVEGSSSGRSEEEE